MIVLNTCYSAKAKRELFAPHPIASFQDIDHPVSDKEAFLSSLKLFASVTVYDKFYRTYFRTKLYEAALKIVQHYHADTGRSNVVCSGDDTENTKFRSGLGDENDSSSDTDNNKPKIPKIHQANCTFSWGILQQYDGLLNLGMTEKKRHPNRFFD